MESVAEAGRETTTMGKVAFASFIGIAIEFYDFYIYGPMGAFLPELYGTRLRYSGAAVSYNLGGVFGGALAPLIAAQLLASTGGSWSISLYVLAMAAITFVCVFYLSETHLTDLSEIRSEERRVVAESRGSGPT